MGAMTPVRTYTPSAEQVAELLLDIGAIQIDTQKPFTWASGWKSPVYCDNRLALSFPHVRTAIKNYLIRVIQQFHPAVEVIAGVATAGIPHATLVADALEKPLVYVRTTPKDHGLKNLIEGKIAERQKVVIVEDLVSTGGSSLKAATALRQAGTEILGMVSVFSYGFDLAEKQFQDAGITLTCLSDYNHLVNIAMKNDLLSHDQITQLKAWRYDPSSWQPGTGT
jgi:orotate phosphoribosyltransferase